MGGGLGGSMAAGTWLPDPGRWLEMPPRGDRPDRTGGNFLCFVEVKLRKSGSFARAGAFVDSRKQEKLRLAAQLYLAENPTQLQPRFDVVEIYAPQGTETCRPQISRVENAF